MTQEKVRVLVVGKTGPLSSANACAKEFRNLGCDVQQFDSHPTTSLVGARKSGRKNLLQRAAFDCLINKSFVDVALKFSPDLIFSQKCDTIYSKSIERVKNACGARYALWYGDNPFNSSVSSWEVIESLKVCDIYYSWGEFMIESLSAAGCQKVKYLPFAFDPIGHNPEVELIGDDHERFDCDICFVGSWDREREKLLESFKDFDLAIYGQNWSKRVNQSSSIYTNIREDSIYGDNFVKAFKGARIVINLMRDFNMPSHNFRTMEATGIGGGVLLTPRTREQTDLLFEENQHMYCYEDIEDAVVVAREILAKGEGELRKMSQQAKQHVFENHLLQYRLEEVLRDLSDE